MEQTEMARGEPRDRLIGKRFGKTGRLIVQKRLQTGGVGMVYLARDERRGRKIAIKFLRPEFARSPEVTARFKREGRRFAELDHPNIVKVYGLGREHGVLYIASEFIEGRDLGYILRDDGRFPVDEALRICRDIASALGAAHAESVVHRDLKPENIMLKEPSGHVMVLDFGIAKSLDGASTLTEKGTYLGTPGYSAPEQIAGRRVDHRADIFPLGAILYEMLTGKLAFEGKHTTEILRASMRARPAPVTRFNEEIVKPVARLIQRMIRKHPQRRFQDMQQVIDAIDGIRSGLDADFAPEEEAGMVGVLRKIMER